MSRRWVKKYFSCLLIDIVGLVIFQVELSMLQREMIYLQYFYNKS